jgi:hypothetical protein
MTAVLFDSYSSLDLQNRRGKESGKTVQNHKNSPIINIGHSFTLAASVSSIFPPLAMFRSRANPILLRSER